MTDFSLAPLSEVGDISDAYKIHQAAHVKPWNEATFADCLTPPYQGLVLYKHQQVVGYAICLFVLDEATLMDIAVLPEARGIGAGKALMDGVTTLAKERQSSVIWLEVRASNQIAQRLYHSYGYEVIEVRKNYYPTVSGKEDAVIMRYDFQPAD